MQERKTTLKNQNNNFFASPNNNANTTSSSNNNNQSDAEQGKGGLGEFLSKIERDIKQGIFQTMYLVVKDCDISTLKLSVLLFIEFLQMIQYAFSSNLKSAWKSDDTYQYVSYVLSFTHIEPWMLYVNFNTYLTIFYICVAVLIITVLSFIYVSYQSTRAKIQIEWPQKLLRGIFIVTNTVVFLPCMELLNSMLVCVDKDGKGGVSRTDGVLQVHYIYKDYKCWTGIHIIHATIGIVCSFIYILISLLITLTFYKNLSTSTDASAKNDSRADMQRQIQKIIVIYIFLFLNTEDEQWFIIVLYFVLSVMTFERYFTLRSFHNEKIQLQHNVYRAVCLWSNISILLSKILQKTSYNGGFQLFFLGSPLIIAITIFARDHRRDELMEAISNFQTGDEVARQVKFFLKIIAQKESGDRNAEILLNGYIYLHEDSCPNNACHLKVYKKNVALQIQRAQNKGLKTSAAISKNLALTHKQDNYQLLLQHARNMFRVGIQRFPNNPALRIQYAFFLVEKLNKKQEAISELNQAQLLHPTFDEEFIIYRHKKILEECFEEQQLLGAQNGQEKTDKYGTQGNQNAVELMTRFAFENTFRQLQLQIERCAAFHMEFWNHLKNDRPDLGKLGDCGSRINSSINNVEVLWSELMKLNSNVPKALKIYGRYQMEILQDKETGQELLQRAKEASNIKQNLILGGAESVSDILQISSDGTPCIFVSGDPERLSYITQCNAGAVRVFGYQAFEMKNQKVEKLMPDMYGKNHSKILEEALAKGPENIPNKERLVFAKHKSGYIFPVWLQLKLIQSLTNEISFIALFKIDKKMMSSNIGFILINKERKVQALSSSCIKLMNLDINWMRKVYQAGYDISRLAPEMETRREELASAKMGLVIEWTIPYFQKKKWIKKASEAVDQYHQNSMKHGGGQKQKEGGGGGGSGSKKNNVNQNESNHAVQVIKKRFQFLCNIYPIIMGSQGEIGNYIRLEVLRRDQLNLQNQQRKRNMKESLRQPLFQFRLDYYSGRFIREIKDTHNPLAAAMINKNPMLMGENIFHHDHDTPDHPNHPQQVKTALVSSLSVDSNEDTQNPASTGSSGDEKAAADPNPQTQQQTQPEISQMHALEELYRRKRTWGKGIEIYALRDGKVQHKDQIDEEKRAIELEEMRRRKMEEEERNAQELSNFTNNIKSKVALKTALNNSHQSSAIRNLRYTMNIVILFLLALAISEFTVISQQFQEINTNFSLIEKSYLRISEIQRVAYDVRSLILINQGRLRNFQSYQTVNQSLDFQGYLKRDIESALNSLYELQNELSLTSLTLSDAHQKMLDLKETQLYFLESSQQNLKIINFTLGEAVLQMSSAIFTVRHLPVTSFNETQDDIFFVMYNSFNDFLLGLTKSSGFLEQELYTRASEKNNLLLILFITSICIVVLSIPILFPAVNSVNKTRERILLLFLEIPNNFIEEMGNRCEQFMTSFYSDDQQDEIKTDDGNNSMKGGGNQTSGSSDSSSALISKRQITKQPKNSTSTNRNFFFQFSFAVALIIAYFAAAFMIAKTYLNDIEVITKELSILAYNEANFAFLQNVQREMIFDRQKKIKNQNSFQVAKGSLIEIYDHVQRYSEVHQQNRASLNQKYMDTYDQIMNGDLCSTAESQRLFQLQLIPQECNGLFNNGPNHGLQSILIIYFEFLREQLNVYRNLTRNIPLNQTQLSRNQSDNLLSSNNFRQMYWLQFNFLQTAFRTLISTLRSTTQIDFDNSVNSKMALFIVFVILVCLSYLIIWTPFITRLTKDILRTRMMLTIVPIHIIMKIPKIQEFLNKQVHRSGGGGVSGSVTGTKQSISSTQTPDRTGPSSSSQGKGSTTNR